MDLRSVPIQNPAVLARKIVDGEMVLVNADNTASLALTNRTAVAVWELTDGRNSVQGIISTLKEQFQNVPETISGDVISFIEEMARDGFIGFERKQLL